MEFVRASVMTIGIHGCRKMTGIVQMRKGEPMDPIDRQAAIDVLKMDTTIIPYEKARQYVDIAIEAISEGLKKLPSAQPEPCEDAVSREAVLDMLHQECSSIVENFMKEKINAMPSVTAKEHPEIIHCRECKHLIDHRCRKIRTLDDWRKPDDFCSYAERREEGGE
jgi:hypothetical protein